MMEVIPLGKLIDGVKERDAIHIAIAPVVAGEKLVPGQDIGFLEGCVRVGGNSDNLIGIVDPFLKRLVMPDQRFWMLLYPNTVTSLRHDWTHPAFDVTSAPASAPDKLASEAWLRAFADECDMSYADLIEAARNFIQSGDYHTLRSSTPDRVYTDRELLWKHFEVVTGEEVSKEDMVSTFIGCAC